MAKRTEIEQNLFERGMAARTMIRLKHRLAAERELNDKLSDAKDNWMRKVQQGQLPGEIDVDVDKVLE